MCVMQEHIARMKIYIRLRDRDLLLLKIDAHLLPGYEPTPSAGLIGSEDA